MLYLKRVPVSLSRFLYEKLARLNSRIFAKKLTFVSFKKTVLFG